MRKGILVGLVAAASVATGSGAVSAQVAVSDGSTDTSTHARHDPWPKTGAVTQARHDPWPKVGAIVTTGYGYKTAAASISGSGAVQQVGVSGIAASVATGGSIGSSTGAGVRIRTRPSIYATVVGYLQRWEPVWVNCYRIPGDGYMWYSLKRGTTPGPSTGWSRQDNIQVGDGSTYRLSPC